MPTVVTEKGHQFIVHIRELPFEPPHVHVRFGEHEVRIEVLGGTFMEQPPPGRERTMLRLFRKHRSAIWTTWDEIHGEESDGV